MKCSSCKGNALVIVGYFVREADGLFNDVIECLSCGTVMCYLPKQVVIECIPDFTVQDRDPEPGEIETYVNMPYGSKLLDRIETDV